MESINFKLEAFEGPLDLLLSLIEKNKIDIYDIEISPLAEQFIAYIKEAEKINISLTADFLEMASHLMYIKSRSLLPRQEEDEEDAKLALENMLLEYAKYKKAASILKPKYIGNLVFCREFMNEELPRIDNETDLEPILIKDAYKRILLRNSKRQAIPMSAFKKIVGHKIVSVASKLIFVLKTLVKKGRTSFLSLFAKSEGRSETVAIFLAVLELLRHGRIDIEAADDTKDAEIVLNKKRV